MGTLVLSEIEEGVMEKEASKIWKRTMEFTDGSPADGLVETSIGNMSGTLSAVRVLFGSPSPDQLKVVVKDVDGHTLLDETLSASGSIYFENDYDIVGGLTLTLSGNTTAGAKADLSVLFH